MVLAREAVVEPELLLVRRHARTSFGSSYVFPGGVVASEDYDIESRSGGFTDAEASKSLDLADGGIAYFSAAIRELFEETGVLLARTKAGGWIDAASLADHRSMLHEHRESWPDFLREFGLTLACDVLRYFSFWVTPAQLPKRFSTRFFLAPLPSDQTASHCGVELTDSRWVSARAALRAAEDGRMELPHPTVRTLEDLAAAASVDELFGWASRRAADGISRIEPAIVSSAGERRISMPGDADYPAHSDDAPAVPRR